MFGSKGRIGVIVPANNSVIEPELWSKLPPDVALFATRVLAKGDLTPAAVKAMEGEVERPVAELAATGVDVIVYADMVPTFVMEEGWNERRTARITEQVGVPGISAWTALRDALSALQVTRFALGTPYPGPVHALTRPFFEGNGYTLSGDATLDILAMSEVHEVTPGRLGGLVEGLDRSGAQAVVLLATDLPTFASIESLEEITGLPVLTSNQTLLWSALEAVGGATPIAGLGRLFAG
jgi:maleate isomerase